MKYIEWNSYSSDQTDAEGFQSISRRKKKRSPKQNITPQNRKTRGGRHHPSDGSSTLEGEVSTKSRYNLRKGVTVKHTG
jgi:hypothetical protein